MKTKILLLTVLLFGTTLLFSQENALLYERVEKTITWNNHGLSNPFTDVELKLYITAPSGRELGSAFTFYGFFDGDGNGAQNGNVWKYRILLDEPGNWQVKAKFVVPGTNNQKTGAPAEQTFNYTVSSNSVNGEHGHAHIDENNWRRYTRADGTPFIPFPIHGSMLLDQTTSTAKQWIDQHANLGVNAITVRFHAESEYSNINAVSYYHWMGTNGNRMTTWSNRSNMDYTKFDVASWQHNEEIIEYAQSKGINLSVWFGISGFNGQYASYGPQDDDGTNLGPLQIMFIKYYMARWAAYTNWWHWTVDSEWEEGGRDEERQKNFALKMREVNPWNTMVTNHSLRDWTLDGQEDGWDMTNLQKRVANTDAGATDCRSFVTNNDDYGIPVYNAEGVWMLSNKTRARIATMTHLMAGGFSHIAHDGSNHTESSWGCVWNSVTTRHKEDAAELGKLTRFFENASWVNNFNQAVPHNELASVSGGNLALCLADLGNAYFVWCDRGGAPTVNLSAGSGEFEVYRYKGTNLTSPTKLANVTAGGNVTLQAGSSSGFGNDYLYVLLGNAVTTVTISTASLPQGQEETVYSEILEANNINGTASWSIASGSLPAGLTLSGNTISGTPTSAGSYTFTIEVTDDVSSDQKEFTIVINETDKTPPVVSNVAAINQNSIGVTITWTTNEPATSRVQWGESAGAYEGESGENTDLVISHAVTINDDFVTGQTYYLLIITTDERNNTTQHEASFVYTYQKVTARAMADVTTGEAPLTVNFTGSATGGNPGNGEYKERDGEVIIEAENFTGNANNGDATNWVVETSVSGYAGDGYVTTPDNGIANGSWGSACEVSYDIDFTTAGTYNIWMYRYGVNGAGNSVFVGVDGNQVGSNDNGGTGSWGWYKYGSANISAGIHTFSIQRREDGYNVDKIILTTSSSTPSGNVQTESETASAYTYSWNFGDGNSSVEKNPTHIYTSSGTYNATLTVADANDSDSDVVTITVGNVAKYALIVNNGSGSGNYDVGQSVNIIADADPITTGGCQVFDAWTGDISYLDDASASNTIVTIPAVDISVTATYKDVTVTGVSLPESILSLVEGSSVQLSETVNPAYACNQSVSWSSSNSSVATVNSSGFVSAIAEGIATITVTTMDGGFTDECILTVEKAPECSADGYISYEKWNGITGVSISQLKSNVNYPDNPDEVGVINSSFQWLGNEDNYGIRIRGYLCVPQDGNYTFWVAGDDNVEFYLSTDENPENASLVAYHTGWTRLDEWNKYGTQRSGEIFLHAGARLYVEALMKENGGGDRLQVGWLKPGQAGTEPSEVIPAGLLSPFVSQNNIPVIGVNFNNSVLSLVEGDSYQLIEIILPANATDKSVNWTSSNTVIATVDVNGLVTAIVPGTAIITATTTDGSYTATCDVTVTAIPTYTLNVNSGSGDGTYQEGTVVTINAATAPAGEMFDAWTGDVANVADIFSSETSITLNTDATVTATYVALPSQLVSNITANSSRVYEWEESLDVGDIYYTDRSYAINSLPVGIEGAEYIRTPNSDKGLSSENVLSFNVSAAATVVIAYDHRASSLPNWMSAYTAAGESIGTGDATLNLYYLDVAPGIVTLGGNKAPGAVGANSNYIVIVVPDNAYKLGEKGLIVEEVEDMDVLVYPNPAYTYVTVSSSMEIESISLLDISGKVLELKSFNSGISQIEFDVSQYKSGLYFIEIHTVEKTKIKKLLIQ